MSRFAARARLHLRAIGLIAHAVALVAGAVCCMPVILVAPQLGAHLGMRIISITDEIDRLAAEIRR